MVTFEPMVALKEQGRFREINCAIPYTYFVNIDILEGGRGIDNGDAAD